MVITAAIVETTMFAAAIGDRLTAGRRSAEDKVFFLAALKYAFKEKAFPPVAGKRLIKGSATAFHHDKSAGSSSFSGEFFRTVPHSVAGRTILCPLCSPHPQNQSEEKKPCPLRLFCLTSPVSALLRSARADVIMTLEARRPEPRLGLGSGLEPGRALQSLTRERNDGKKRDGK